MSARDPLDWLRSRMLAHGMKADDVEVAIEGEDIPLCVAHMEEAFRRAMAVPDTQWQARVLPPMIQACSVWLHGTDCAPTTRRHRPHIARIRRCLCALASALRRGDGSADGFRDIAAQALHVLARAS